MNASRTLLNDQWIVRSTKVSVPVKRAVSVALGVGLLSLFAQITVPLPFTPVPLTMQTFGILAIAGSMGSRWGSLTTAIYLGIGAMGLPVFADQSGGIQVIFGATGGYLVGMLVATYLMGLLAEKGWDRSISRSLAMFTIGHVTIFAAGLLWLGQAVPDLNVWQAGLVPFLPGAVFKTLLATGLFPTLRRWVG